LNIQQIHCQVKSRPPPTQPKEKANFTFAFAGGGFLLKLFQVDQPKPVMSPAPGERLVRFVGDKIIFQLRAKNSAAHKHWSARLRTNLGRADVRRQEIISAHTGLAVSAGASWCDVPMQKTADGWQVELPLAEVGWFKSKAYLLDEKNWQHWPDGSDVGVSVHPNFARTANTIYCAFTRLFGATKHLAATADEKLETQLKSLEAQGYATLPPSGKFRDLTKQLPFIVNQLGCRIIHLLPVHPTPTTYARFGRFGSPYAALDLTAVDPALVEFDQRTTGIDQFCELASAAHSLGARVFIDIVINHTGWGSTLQENHPEFFLKKSAGEFASPGAWGTVWEDLVELEQHSVKLWDLIADSLLTWCRRGVDGFRCDAGYKVPTVAWQYIIARVQEEFPETIFLLEGLGGAWDATESLLTEGGMQWAYSELFQNYSGKDVAWYLDYANRQNERVGSYVHYSETHDNQRLAAHGAPRTVPASCEELSGLAGTVPGAPTSNRAWSLLRNRLCALTSSCGGFGFTCGVEWLAAEKIRVHGNTGLNWSAAENIVPELAQLNRLISDHPCFFDGAKLTRLSAPDAPVYALLRESAEGKDAVLVLVNTDVEKENAVALERRAPPRLVEEKSFPLAGTVPGAPADLKSEISHFKFELLGQPLPKISGAHEKILFHLPPGGALCLAPTEKPLGLAGEDYRRTRAQAAFAFEALNKIIPVETVDGLNWRWLAEQAARSPKNLLAAASEFAARDAKTPLSDLLREVDAGKIFPRVVTWTLLDARRVTLVPPGHWLLLEDSAPFRATLERPKAEGRMKPGKANAVHVQSVPAGNVQVACFAPRDTGGEARLSLERHAAVSQKVSAAIRFLAPEPQPPTASSNLPAPDSLVLLTNGRGGMARLGVDLGRIRSKYDCALGANLNPAVPVDRHVFVKRLRVWVNADGFLSPLDFKNLAAFQAGSPSVWHFTANAGDGRTVEIELRAEMLAEENTVVFQFSRPTEKKAQGKQLPADADVRLTVRVDIEDRNFHCETKRNGGADFHFSSNCHPCNSQRKETHAKRQSLVTSAATEVCVGFAFTPAHDRQLRVFADAGEYHPQPEWCENIPHPVEQSRGQTGSGDAYSPGWFELPLAKGASTSLTLTAEAGEAAERRAPSRLEKKKSSKPAETVLGVPFDEQLERAAKQFVVRRDEGKTVIAGYPWFLDWGRDSLICARGLLAAGMVDDVKQLLLTFAKFEKDGTLPNTIHGHDVSNRDTSDAPLWFAVVCEDLADKKFFNAPVLGAPASLPASSSGRTIRDVLASIAENYALGTPNGIHMDADSALIWSPSHFTWMDTNHPAGTPREGYPVEIQVLWIRLLRLLEKIAGVHASACSADTLKRELQQKKWRDLADRATASFEKLFWLEDQGWFADVLLGGPRVIARDAVRDDALRSNCLFAVSLGLVTGERAKRCVAAAQKYLVMPGALRSLAPLPVAVPLPIHRHGHLLNHPTEPYWPRYEGDEDTRRKPAYHNGTAWTWTFPTFCEALARAWDFSPAAVAAAKSYLGSAEKILNQGCLGQLPELLDGDAPHTQRGCDAQAWGATEALRVWKLLAGKAA
jgi:predicted glycogen debranching enzyme